MQPTFEESLSTPIIFEDSSIEMPIIFKVGDQLQIELVFEESLSNQLIFEDSSIDMPLTFSECYGIGDAPFDDKQYARQNGAWVEVTGGGGGASNWSQIQGKPFSTIDTNTLKVENNILKVFTTNNAEGDNTKPITSAGVHTIVGNINALLELI